MDQQQQAPDQGRKIADPDRWTPGKYRAKPVDWNASKTKEGLPQVSVLFEYEQDKLGGAPGAKESRQLIWFGSFKGGARERTLDTLVLLGLRDPVSSMETGRDGKALAAEQEVEIVVEHRIWQGERKAGIAWVNQIGGRGLQHDKLAPGESKALFADVDQDFQATLMAKGLMKNDPSKPSGTIAQQIQQQGMFNDSDIPF